MGEKSAFFTVCFSSVREGLNIIIRGIVGFCFGDRDFPAASHGVYAILCSCKERLCQESTLRGLRREVSPDLLRRTEMKSKAGAQCGSAPRDPSENGQAGRAKQQRYCAERRKFLYSGKKCLFASRAARSDLAFPSRGRCPVVPLAELLRIEV